MLFDQSNKLEAAGMTKNRIVVNLVERLKKNKDFVAYVHRQKLTTLWPGISIDAQTKSTINTLIHGWAGTSGDANAQAIAMQMAAQREFNLIKSALGHFSKADISAALKMLKTDGKALQAFLRAQYNLTQEYFKRNGIKSLTGYRGMGFLEKVPGLQFGDDLATATSKLQLQPMSSFSTDIVQARIFARDTYRPYKMLTQSEIPINRILSTCQTGFGCKSEAEFVLLGGQDVFKVATIRGTFYESGDDILRYLARFKVVPKVPVWKPTMTAKEAKAWAKGSVYEKEVFYHGTTKGAGSKVMEEGFKLGKLGEYTGNGGILGAGHYVSPLKGMAAAYSGPEGKILSLKTNLMKVLTNKKEIYKFTKFAEQITTTYENFGALSLSEAKLKASSLMQPALNFITEKDWIAIKGIMRKEKFGIEMSARYLFKKEGYGAVYYKEIKEMVVFDDKSLIVIK